MEEEMTEDKPILKWAHRWADGLISNIMYSTRNEARVSKYLYPSRSQPSVVRVQITVLKDRK